jgi:hypothetical protein
LGESASPGRCFCDKDTWVQPKAWPKWYCRARFRRLVELSSSLSTSRQLWFFEPRVCRRAGKFGLFISGLSPSRQLCFAELEFVVQLEFVVVARLVCLELEVVDELKTCLYRARVCRRFEDWFVSSASLSTSRQISLVDLVFVGESTTLHCRARVCRRVDNLFVSSSSFSSI